MLTNQEKTFLTQFVAYCKAKGIEYHGANVEQMEAYMLSFLKESGHENKMKVSFSPMEI
jgi:hypothetical protein